MSLKINLKSFINPPRGGELIGDWPSVRGIPIPQEYLQHSLAILIACHSH
jgi:hypothetical protein